MGCINKSLERMRREGCVVKSMLGICLVEAMRYKCEDSGAVSCW